ncbi:ROK family glucokinase [Peribacillus simplex]|uniref:ROK family glucokinase n=1 Tax=Peribacillus simplex TaxID=1478 RepID=UPI0011DCD24C|nr:ROK family glucokinase [Peribacillus simplex]MDR4927860.1 ROK family glucokinase [Peribacillus simplex]MED3984273.1 ROK family glucokinase [Peribacillus simplex]MED4097079.1 ROK family glucokinase [Peribacillus simplex]WHX93075.1 ROK family glucokinase [Peribacillus simplex]CAH0298330.1 Glucokinase [Peribacillus simplex]
MDEKWLVGADIGGTTIKMAFINQNGEIIYKWEIPTNINEKGKNIPKEMAKSIDQTLSELGQEKQKLIGIGVGAPGPVNLGNGSIDVAVNLGWNNFPLKDLLEMGTSLPVIVDNDANAAAIGEMWKGAGQGSKDLLCITLGTGVGGGIISNGQIVHGINGAGGEIGHITSLVEDGAPCNCGKTGCIETIASATGIVRLAIEELSFTETPSRLRDFYNEHQILSSELVFEVANEGDELANRVIGKVTLYLGLALAHLANGLNPEKIIIGGGVSKAGDALLVPLKEQFTRFAFPRVLQGVELANATLGNDAGIMGGAWLVKKRLLNRNGNTPLYL